MTPVSGYQFSSTWSHFILISVLCAQKLIVHEGFFQHLVESVHEELRKS